ncbi:MAG: gamma carbonic anhydrase family protein [Xanthomonadaceae bacterium]|jgi:carbonic anhydrase/acetyltransferase-like protein (isoleucine patch superfamily)|nr:gamma carbonic anhydrase family protein [Xanthomonadaceae bacterium]
MNNLRPYLDKRPALGERVYLDSAATVIGDVVLADDVSIWPGAIVRGDVNHVRIAARSNIQDGAVIHVSHHSPFNRAGYPTLIGEDVTVGHGAIVHACTIGDGCLVGMGACVLDGSVIGRHSLIGAGAVVSPGKQVGEGELWVGNPARCVRKLGERDIESLLYSSAHYVRLKNDYLGMPS